ncbi:MAG: four helix bundle protein [Saprospiraceae bacterium]
MYDPDLKGIFLRYSLAIYQLTRKFPKETVYFILIDQIIRASASSGANYRASQRGKSVPDFINKLKIVEEELDETLYWLEYTNGVDSKWISETKDLMKEGNELLAITVASIKTSRLNSNRPKSKQSL